jgi:hypothetical protein
MVAEHKQRKDMRIKKMTRGLAPIVLLAATPATLVFAYDSYDECRNDASQRHADCDAACDNAFPNGGSELDSCKEACTLQEQRDEAACHDEFEWC